MVSTSSMVDTIPVPPRPILLCALNCALTVKRQIELQRSHLVSDEPPLVASIAPCSCRPGRCAPAQKRRCRFAASRTALARGALPAAGRDGGMSCSVEQRDGHCFRPWSTCTASDQTTRAAAAGRTPVQAIDQPHHEEHDHMSDRACATPRSGDGSRDRSELPPASNRTRHCASGDGQHSASRRYRTFRCASSRAQRLKGFSGQRSSGV